MAKQPPKRYSPGELEQTRSRLGTISDDEAQRLSELFGGVVGTERTEAEVEARYQKLRERNRRRTDRMITGGIARDLDTPPRSKELPTQGKRKRIGYRDRVRMDFACARPEHGIKTFGSAMLSLLSFAGSTEDRIHPKFVAETERLFRHIEDLVVSVRGLLALNRRHPAHRLNPEFYRDILGIIRDWEIEAIHSELGRLDRYARHLNVSHCGRLGRAIFTPLIRLSDIDAEYHLKAAVKLLWELDATSMAMSNPDIEKIESYYDRSIFEIEYIFGPLKHRLYPLLMKLSSSRYRSAETFYPGAREEILLFLGIGTEQCVTLRPIESNEDSPAKTTAAIDNIGILERTENQKGLEVLERLFPRAGWNRLDEFPDLYPYLEPFLGFPRSFCLVNPEDPIHQVFVLISVLRELFYGFHAIRFGALPDFGSIGMRIGELTEGWRILRDEFVSGSYLPGLHDYCREIERTPRFVDTEYGQRVTRDLMWQKKEYLLPHLSVRRGNTPDVKVSIPRLPDLVREFSDLIQKISIDLVGSKQEEIRSVLNPWDGIVFDIDSGFTLRLKSVMKRYGEERNNANLLLYSFSLLTLLDSLINTETSFYYPFPIEPIHRTTGPDTLAPLYSVPVADVDAIIRQAENELPEIERPEPEVLNTVDDLTSMANENGYRDRLEEEIGVFRNTKRRFSIIAFEVADFESYYDEHGEELGVTLLRLIGEIIREQIREFRDFPGRMEKSLFAILLPDTIRDEALHLAIRLIESCNSAAKVDIYIGVIEFHPTWSRDRGMRMIRRSVEAAREIASPSICVYEERTDTFVSLRDRLS